MAIGWNPFSNIEETRKLVERMIDLCLAHKPIHIMTAEEFENEKKRLHEKESREREKRMP